MVGRRAVARVLCAPLMPGRSRAGVAGQLILTVVVWRAGMFQLLRRIVLRLLGTLAANPLDSLSAHIRGDPSEDPCAGVRVPRTRRPGGRHSAASVEEPIYPEPVRVVGRAADPEN
jgi:hypothetical protein